MMLLALVLAPRPGMSAGLPEATGLRFGESGPRTRVVVDFDRSVAFAARAESNPDQLLVELGEVDWRLARRCGAPAAGPRPRP